LIGRPLLKSLGNAGHTLHVLSRHAGMNMPAGVRLSAWDPVKGEPPADSLREADAVIHLAGEPVAQRWTDEAKRRIRDSRVTGTRNLVQALAKLPQRPEALICSSAVGYYGSRGDEVLVESSGPGDGYLADVCKTWEDEARAAEGLGMRVVRVRTGVVLDTRGGALQRMLKPFRMGMGGKLGSGRQWMSWIHILDLVELFRFAAEKPAVRGVLNGTAPNPVVNADFTRALASAVRRPAIFPAPEFMMHLMFGEMASVLFASQRVLPKEPEAAGFSFRFPQLPAALADLLK
jgi:uncharacterized protein (TIGR01777 family)